MKNPLPAPDSTDRDSVEALLSIARDAADFHMKRDALIDLTRRLPFDWDRLHVPALDSIRRHETVRGALRTRSLCPLCNRAFLLRERPVPLAHFEDARPEVLRRPLANHGYTRQGGWQSGSCAGSGRTPEQALEIALDRFHGIRAATDALAPGRILDWMGNEETNLRNILSGYRDDDHCHVASRTRRRLADLEANGLESSAVAQAVSARTQILRSHWSTLRDGLNLLLTAL